MKTKGLLNLGATGSFLTAGMVVLIIVVSLFNLAVFGLAIWALVFGIINIATVGVNAWAVVWIILGALGILGTIGGK